MLPHLGQRALRADILRQTLRAFPKAQVYQQTLPPSMPSTFHKFLIK
jgi:hypothetical protein